ncbi:hypothetical protein H257_08655 [Aphanomyces astaci]|uniref:Complex 1 LYR protein domain-containing protein n=1 Tax=Aphanomyces astaci TaxID=112090 RepID=W4GFS8_APHAT|nr:hypothetical protein H257_08655 [Aphanomyces astaci]ETV77828.1 hypothetical protein H257_08655 [Aphanomyces astaci]|eukprot:XP_009832938.1 hypothetical protein H257_08655 [Aphanomyces astaci]
MATNGVGLYRQVCRVAREFPPLMGKKIRFNAREILRLRRHEQDPVKAAAYLRQGEADVATLRLVALSPSLVDAMDRKPPQPAALHR